MTGKSIISMDFNMPPDELKQHVAHLIAVGIYRARLPWLPGEKIKQSDLIGVATFVIGGLMGLESEEKKKEGN
jgi:hypothetical protein